MVHRVYMCSNLKYPLVVQEFDQVEGCNNNNHILSTSPSFVLKKQVNFQEGERYWLLPTTCPPTKLKPRTVCCQEGEDDEDMSTMDMTMIVKYKMSSFQHLHSNFWYNSLGSTCTCPYLIEGPIVFQSASSSKLNFRFVGRLIVNHCECHDSVIRSAIEVHEIFMESLRFQIDLVPPQYLVGKIFKSSRHSVVVSARSYIVIMGTWVPDLSSGSG